MPPVPRPSWIEALEQDLSDLQDLGHEVFVGLPAPEVAIARFEDALGVILPLSYRDLVTTYGWLELDGIAIFGLERAEVQTLSARALYELPDRCIVVQMLEGGAALLCLDTQKQPLPAESALLRFETSGHAISLEEATLSQWITALVALRLKFARGARA